MTREESKWLSAGYIFRILRRKHGKLTANQVFCMKAKPGNDAGVKAFYADISLVRRNQVIGLPAEFRVVLAGFELTDNRHSAAN